jgi:polyphosphate kinase 2 (PPK2 family)
MSSTESIGLELADLPVAPGRIVNLANCDPAATGSFTNKRHAREMLRTDILRLAALQDVLYAQGRHALLIIVQGMDAAGKDGAIKHVMTGVNPQGVDVTSFKVPSAVELGHEYLWRSNATLPARGKIAIFNRSYYEELAVVRVHPAVLAREERPSSAISRATGRAC